MIVRSGATALTLRAVADLAGVSHGALYRHFANRDALLDDVAATWIDEVIAATDDSSLDEFVEGYLRAALAAPALYRCAFDVAADPGAAATRAALARLRDHAARAYQQRTGAADAELRDGVLRLWSTVHGMIDLYWRGLVRARSAAAAAQYISAATLRLVPPPPSPS